MAGQRGVALEALRRYDVAPRRVTLAAESYNSIFRVATASAVYALRVGPAVQIHSDGTSAVEAAWHRRLRRRGVRYVAGHAERARAWMRCPAGL